jgi:hypothetical protein
MLSGKHPQLEIRSVDGFQGRYKYFCILGQYLTVVFTSFFLVKKRRSFCR